MMKHNATTTPILCPERRCRGKADYDCWFPTPFMQKIGKMFSRVQVSCFFPNPMFFQLQVSSVCGSDMPLSKTTEQQITFEQKGLRKCWQWLKLKKILNRQSLPISSFHINVYSLVFCFFLVMIISMDFLEDREKDLPTSKQ